VIILGTALVLLGLFTLPFWYLRFASIPQSDFLAPAKLAGALHVLSTIPYLLLLAFSSDAMHPLVRFHPSVRDLDTSVAWFGFVQAIAFLAILIGISSGIGTRLAGRLPLVATRFTHTRAFLAVGFATACGLGSFLFILSKIGGYVFLLQNMGNRAALLEGLGYFMSMLVLLSYPALILVYRLRHGISLTGVVLAITATMGAAVVFSSMGGRRSTIVLLIFLSLVWHYGVRRIRRPTLVLGVMGALMLPYMVAVPILRTPEGPRFYMNNPDALMRVAGENLDIAVKHTSYVDQYILITSYFGLDRLWLGRTYLDLLTAPIPSSILKDKPPVDDGVYIRTIADGQDIQPNSGRRSLNRTSWPPETLGITYLNFWLPGVILGMALLGVLYRAAYEYMRRSSYSLYSIVLYATFLINLHLSNLRIVSMTMTLTLTTLFFVLFFGFRASRRRAPGPIPSQFIVGA
jgi:hypothetical protein